MVILGVLCSVRLEGVMGKRLDDVHIPVGSTVKHTFHGLTMTKKHDGLDIDSDSYWESGSKVPMIIPDSRVRLRLSQKDGVLRNLVEVENDD